MKEYILPYNIFLSVNFKIHVYLHLSFLFVMLSENLVYDRGLSYTVFIIFLIVQNWFPMNLRF